MVQEKTLKFINKVFTTKFIEEIQIEDVDSIPKIFLKIKAKMDEDLVYKYLESLLSVYKDKFPKYFSKSLYSLVKSSDSIDSEQANKICDAIFYDIKKYDLRSLSELSYCFLMSPDLRNNGRDIICKMIIDEISLFPDYHIHDYAKSNILLCNSFLNTPFHYAEKIKKNGLKN